MLGNHPRIKELRAQIADLDQQITKEAETLARSFENDAKLADARLAAQLVTFNQLKKQAETSNEDDVQLRALERDAKSQRDLLDPLAKYRDASSRGTLDSSPAEARIISRATPSSVSAYPKKLPTVLIASLATFMLMCAWSVVTRALLETSGVAGLPEQVGRCRPRPAEPRGRGGQRGTIPRVTKPRLTRGHVTSIAIFNPSFHFRRRSRRPRAHRMALVGGAAAADPARPEPQKSRDVGRAAAEKSSRPPG